MSVTAVKGGERSERRTSGVLTVLHAEAPATQHDWALPAGGFEAVPRPQRQQPWLDAAHALHHDCFAPRCAQIRREGLVAVVVLRALTCHVGHPTAAVPIWPPDGAERARVCQLDNGLRKKSNRTSS